LYRFSVKLFGEIDDWTQDQLDALAEKAKIVWGSSELWEKAQVSEIGKIVRKYLTLCLLKFLHVQSKFLRFEAN
jgi:hypothetical protein